MEILVTGGAGMVGSHLIRRLSGHNVTVIDDLSNGKPENLEGTGVRFLKDDISSCDIRFAGKFDVVFHLACHPRSISFDNPFRDVDVNVKGMVNVLEYAKRSRALVVFSSNSGIWDTSKMPVVEGTADNPTSPYDIDKLSAEWFCKIYSELYGVRCVIFRFAAIYGPRQSISEEWKPVVITFLRTLMEGGKCEIHGDGEQTRDLAYVGDIVDALVMAIDRDNVIGRKMSLGTGVQTSINQLQRICAETVGGDAVGRPCLSMPRKPGDIRDMCYPSNLARELLGWEAKTALREGVKMTYEWLRGGAA